jgi:hypothetical protein
VSEIPGLTTNVVSIIRSIEEESRQQISDWQGTYYSSENYEQELIVLVSSQHGAAYVLTFRDRLQEQGYGIVKKTDDELELEVDFEPNDLKGGALWFSDPLLMIMQGTDYYLVPKGYVHGFLLMLKEKDTYVKAACLSKSTKGADSQDEIVNVPANYRHLVDVPPIIARVSQILDTRVAPLRNKRNGAQVSVTRVVLDAGSAQHLYVGMRFQPDLVVTAVEAETAIAEKHINFDSLEFERINVGDVVETPAYIVYYSE